MSQLSELFCSSSITEVPTLLMTASKSDIRHEVARWSIGLLLEKPLRCRGESVPTTFYVDTSLVDVFSLSHLLYCTYVLAVTDGFGQLPATRNVMCEEDAH